MSEIKALVLTPLVPGTTGNPIAVSSIPWVDQNGNAAPADAQALTVRDPISGNGLSITMPGNPGANAAAFQGIPGGVPLPVSLVPWTPFAIAMNATGSITVKNAPGTLAGIYNLDPTVVQAYEIDVYDGATKLFTIVNMGEKWEPAVGGILHLSSIILVVASPGPSKGLTVLFQ